MGVCLIEKANPHLPLWGAEMLGLDVGLERSSELVNQKSSSGEIIQEKEEQVDALGPESSVST